MASSGILPFKINDQHLYKHTEGRLLQPAGIGKRYKKRSRRGSSAFRCADGHAGVHAPAFWPWKGSCDPAAHAGWRRPPIVPESARICCGLRHKHLEARHCLHVERFKKEPPSDPATLSPLQKMTHGHASAIIFPDPSNQLAHLDIAVEITELCKTVGRHLLPQFAQGLRDIGDTCLIRPQKSL